MERTKRPRGGWRIEPDGEVKGQWRASFYSTQDGSWAFGCGGFPSVRAAGLWVIDFMLFPNRKDNEPRPDPVLQALAGKAS